MLPVLGLNMAVRLVCSVEETKIVYSLLNCVQHMLLKRILVKSILPQAGNK